MKPRLEEIKRCYRGQERYYYIRTLHRQFGYNAFKSLIPVLSLLLQIPFFIAAYQFLEHFEPLEGQRFLGIQDLSAPDGLLGSVNLLPIVMTIVNVITAYYYTRRGDASERKQMLVVAGIFLVLLYRFPAGLVLYWTMNNVFSFFRLFITNPEVFRGKKREGGTGFLPRIGVQVSRSALRSTLQRTFAFYTRQLVLIRRQLIILFGVLLVLVIASQVNWAVQNTFDDFALRMVVAPLATLLLSLFTGIAYTAYRAHSQQINKLSIQPQLPLTLLFFASYFYLASRFYFTEHTRSLTSLGLVFTIPLQIISVFYFMRSRNSKGNPLYSVTSIVLILLHVIQLVTFAAIVSDTDFSFNLLNAHLTVEPSGWNAFNAVGIVISILAIPFFVRSRRNGIVSPPKYHWLLATFSILYIAGLIFFWNPIRVYSSYPKNFDFPAIDIVLNNFQPFIFLAAGSFLLYLVTPKHLKNIYLKVILWVAGIVFLYSSIIPFDAGTLQFNLLSNEQNLAKETLYYILEALFLVVIFYGISWLITLQRTRPVLYGLILINLLLIGQSIYMGIKTETFFKKEAVTTAAKSDEKSEISFSKDKQNIVLFIIDGAQGWYMHDLVEEDSTFREAFSGFTYYPNTLAMANYTYASVPSIMCGYAYSIAQLNLDNEKTILQKVSQATECFYKKVKDDGFDFTSTILRYSSIDHNKFDYYIPSWHPSWSEQLGLKKPEEMWYTRLWENAMFSSAPLFLKPRVYNHAKWIIKEKSNLNLSEFYQYNFVRALPKISNTSNPHPNFIYIHSLYTHNPWNMINEKNELIRDVTPYESQRAFTYTFAEWLAWMKEHGVYDNTKIILVSDHGPDWWHFKGDITITAPIVWTEEKKISLDRFLHLNALLMVKDFNSDYPLREDWRLMNIADVSAIAFNENDPTKADSTSRTLPTFFTAWHNDLKTRTQYEIKHAFEVTDYVYDLHNWKAIDE
jgi:YidC/Oxa1 family membrane protein insertase